MRSGTRAMLSSAQLRRWASGTDALCPRLVRRYSTCSGTYAATHDDTRWTHEIFPAIGELLLIERTVVIRAIPTPASPLR